MAQTQNLETISPAVAGGKQEKNVLLPTGVPSDLAVRAGGWEDFGRKLPRSPRNAGTTAT